MNGVASAPPVESVVLVEARVFGGDRGVLQLGRDCLKGHKLVALAIWLRVNPGLGAALHLHRRGRRIDPLKRDELQRAQQPQSSHTDRKPFENGSERHLSQRFPGL